MTSYLGASVSSVPGLHEGVIWVIDKRNAGKFDAADERLLAQYAGFAKVLLGNQRLFDHVREERSVLSAIQMSMTDGLIVLSRDGTVIHCNARAAAFINVTIESVLGGPAEDLFVELRANFVLGEQAGEVLAVLEIGLSAPLTFAATRRDPGPSVDLAITAFPIAGAAGSMTGFLLHDVTLERELLHRREALISIASHELRTPLTSIRGFAELIATQDPPSERRRQWLGYVLDGADRLTRITDDLVEVSRLEAGRVSLTPEELSLGDIVARSIEEVRHSTQVHTIAADIAGDVASIWADRFRLQQVLVNLLSNAIKYSPNGGAVVVSARRETALERVIVGVSDRGMGISLEDQTRLFTAFTRLDRPEMRGIGGTGLGLSIVKGLVELMGGEVWIESEINVGATFFFSVPTAPMPIRETQQ